MADKILITEKNYNKITEQKNIKFINLNIYKITQIQREHGIKDFQKKVKQNKIKDLFIINEYSLWSFLEPLILGISLLPDLLDFPAYWNLYPEITKLNFIFDKEKPKEIIVSNVNKSIEQVILKLCEKKRINMKIISSKKQNFPTNRYIFNPFLVENYLKLRFFLRMILSKKTKPTNTEILFLTSDRFNKQKNEDNIIFGPVIKELKKQKRTSLLVDYDRTYQMGIFKLINNLLSNPESKFIGSYYTKKVNKKTKELYKTIKTNLNEIKTDQRFRNLFIYKGIDLWDLFEEQVDYIFEVIPLYLADMLAITEEILKIEKPKVAVLVSESDFYSKALILNSKKYNTKTVALQFGPIRKTFSDLNPTNDILPDIKCVDGIYEKNITTKVYNYPKEIIRVTGEPRYDCLVKNDWNKEKILEKLKLNPKRKILVFMDTVLELTLKFLPEMLNLVKNYKIQIIIKLHPDTPNKWRKKYKNCIENEKNIRIIEAFNTSKLIYLSDVVITFGSTVAIEAIIADKLLILLDPFYIDIEPRYAEEGGALIVHNEKQFREMVKSCLFDKKLIDKLKITREKSKRRHTGYNPQGKATDEVVKIIERFL